MSAGATRWSQKARRAVVHHASVSVVRPMYRTRMVVDSPELGRMNVFLDVPEVAALARDLVGSIAASKLIERLGSPEAATLLLDALETLATDPADVLGSGLEHSGGA